jgi:hypothetical protein
MAQSKNFTSIMTNTKTYSISIVELRKRRHRKVELSKVE